jgi:hypothetical protein
MKKSNIIISSIGLLLLGVVILCLMAYRERPEWKAEREKQRNPVVEMQAIEKMAAFATKCTQVEELVLESSKNLRGQVSVSDSSQFRQAGNGEMKIDTVLENGGKKLTIRIEPKTDAQVIYYDIQLLLPLVKTIRVNNVNMGLQTKRRGMNISLKGESLCNFRGVSEPGSQIELTDLSALYLIPRKTDSIQIRASGNAIVNTVEQMGKLMQQTGKLVLTQNAIIRNY